jgi:hypothetical protein
VSEVWRFPRQLGSHNTFLLVGSVPVAVLAGFALATGVSVAKDADGAAGQVAVGALGVGVACFLLTLNLVLRASNYIASPDERLALRPEARVDPAALEAMRRWQWEDHVLLAHYAQRINLVYPLGLIATLVGFGAAVLAVHVNAGTVVAAVAVGVLVLLELIEQLTGRALPRALFRDLSDVEGQVERPPLDRIGERALLLDDDPEPPELFGAGVRGRAGLEADADRNGTGKLYRASRSIILDTLDGCYTTEASCVGTGVVHDRHRRVVALHPLATTPTGELLVSIAISDAAAWLRIGEQELVERLAALRPLAGPPGAHGWFGLVDDGADLAAVLTRAERPEDQPS